MAKNYAGLACSKCGTNDFSIPGRSFELAFACRTCCIVFCHQCAGREERHEGIPLIRCYKCGGDVIDASRIQGR